MPIIILGPINQDAIDAETHRLIVQGGETLDLEVLAAIARIATETDKVLAVRAGPKPKPNMYFLLGELRAALRERIEIRPE